MLTAPSVENKSALAHYQGTAPYLTPIPKKDEMSMDDLQSLHKPRTLGHRSPSVQSRTDQRDLDQIKLQIEESIRPSTKLSLHQHSDVSTAHSRARSGLTTRINSVLDQLHKKKKLEQERLYFEMEQERR